MEKTLFIFLVFSIFYVVSNAFVTIKDNTHLENSNPTKDLTKNIKYTNNTQNFPLANQIKTTNDIKKIAIIRFRYFPILHRQTRTKNNSIEECLPSSSEDFPPDLFTMEARQRGAIILHFILGVYCFILLAIVCNDYFLPAIEFICQRLKLSEDIAAATFMAIGTSAPEFFVNIVGTFITESDIGVGTIVGSSMFNTLGVAALGGLACKTYIQLDWWPITRDSIIYIFTVTMLVLIAQDKVMNWYEAAILVVFYVIYFIIMWQNERIYRLVLKISNSFKRKRNIFSQENKSHKQNNCVINTISSADFIIVKPEIQQQIITDSTEEPAIEKQTYNSTPFSLWKYPQDGVVHKIWWLFSWPVRLLLILTIPDCRRYPAVYGLTFVMSIVWIGINSYLVSWMIAVIGATFHIPDFIMGVTFLAAGGCLPEAISIVIVARKGIGSMGVSNSLGANTLDILLCLGLPWLIKILVNWSSGQNNYINMDSDSLFYTIIALILSVLILYVTVFLSGYRLSKKVGVVLIILYVLFLSTAIVLEQFLYYDGKLEPC